MVNVSMEKLKIAITGIGTDTSGNLFRSICEYPVMSELCTPIVYDSAGQETALRNLDEGKVDALVLTVEPTKKPAEAIEIIVTGKTNFMPVSKEPTAEDVVKFRDILERDFDLRSPRIAIVQESPMQTLDFASQVTAEQGINTYGPYTTEQILTEDAVCHFDGIIVKNGEHLMQRLITDPSQEAPVRYFAGMKSVITAVYRPVHIDEAGDGVADVSELTHPIYTAIDIIRNRAFFDEARQNILPKLFHDKREERKQNGAPQASTNNDNTEQAYE